jgi:hypothetical protein
VRPERYLELYSKYINGRLNVNGVLLKPIKFEDNVMTLKMSNPKDKSYSYHALEGFVNESFESFQELIGAGGEDIPSPTIQSDDDVSFYISGELFSEIKEYLKNILVLKYKECEIHVKPMYFDISLSRGSEVKIVNCVKPLNAFIRSRPNNRTKSDILETVFKYRDYQNKARFDETEFVYPLIDDILEKEKSLMDEDWMIGYISTEFVDFK